MHQPGYFYIMTNAHHTILYCGATNDLYKRVQEHKNKMYTNSFTSRYNIEKLVYFEIFTKLEDVFGREKQIKAGSGKKKIELIESVNPQWKDLFETLSQQGSLNELIEIYLFA
jgi:putative endonuclease